MTTYLLDVGPLGALLGNRPTVTPLLFPLMRQGVRTTSTSIYGELIEHLQGFPDYLLRRSVLRRLLRGIPIITLNRTTMERYATLRRALRPPHGPGLFGDMDPLIAATALVRDLTGITADSDYGRVQGLKVLPVALRP